MTIELVSTIDIAATPEQVWAVLSDFSTFGEWSNFTSIEGAPEEGSRLKIRMPGMSFRPFVTSAVPNETLQWSATIASRRFFLGQHTFTLIRKDDGTTTLINGEVFAGASVKPFGRIFSQGGKDDGYVSFNRALKDRVESRTSADRSARP